MSSKKRDQLNDIYRLRIKVIAFKNDGVAKSGNSRVHGERFVVRA